MAGHLDYMHTDAGGPGDRRKFEADKAGADHDHLTNLGQPLAQHVGIGQGSQRQHAVQFGARDGERPTARPRGENKMVASHLAAGGQSQAPPGTVYRGDGFAGNQIDLLLLVKRFGPQPKLIQAAFAGEIGFRQGRALIRQYRLVADQHDATAETLLPQRRRRLKTGLAGADDRNDLSGHQTCVSGRYTMSPSISGVTTS